MINELELFYYRFQSWKGASDYSRIDLLNYERIDELIRDPKQGTNFYVAMHSKLYNNLHLCLLDYDLKTWRSDTEYYTNRKILLGDIIERMRYYKKSGHIYETLYGYHVILTECLPLELYLRLLDDFDCCKGFVWLSQNRGSALRVGRKPERDSDIRYLGFFQLGESNPTNELIAKHFIAAKQSLEMYLDTLYKLKPSTDYNLDFDSEPRYNSEY